MIDLKIVLFQDIEQITKLVKLKRESPEEYKQLWIDSKEITRDMINVAKELIEEINNGRNK